MLMQWTAIYNDKTYLKQFKGEKENLFKDINQDKLVKFRIDDDVNNVLVNLINGSFIINHNIFEVPELSNKDTKYRLIYFRRNRVSLSTSGNTQPHTVENFIGFQININGKNRQFMISELDGILNVHFK